MRKKNVGIGEYLILNEAENILMTFAQGSCVAVLIYDWSLRIAGMGHIALPDSAVDPVKAEERPAYYIDTGLPLLIEAMKKVGGEKKHIWIKITGGANTLNIIDSFDIGRRNVTAIKKYLRKIALGPITEDAGGKLCRKVSMSVASGDIQLSCGSKKWGL